MQYVWQRKVGQSIGEELARHVAYLPILCEQAGVDEHELHRAIEIHFYVRSMSKGAMQ